MFGEDGTELLTFAGLETDTRVWVSAGDPWRDPNMKGILQSPTRRALPADHRLASPPAKRVYAKRNGDASDDSVIVVARTWGVTPERAMQILLRDCTAKLKLFRCDGLLTTGLVCRGGGRGVRYVLSSDRMCQLRSGSFDPLFLFVTIFRLVQCRQAHL